jgi:hypothetical protein
LSASGPKEERLMGSRAFIIGDPQFDRRDKRAPSCLAVAETPIGTNPDPGCPITLMERRDLQGRHSARRSALIPRHLEFAPPHATLGGAGFGLGVDCRLSDYCGHASRARRRD